MRLLLLAVPLLSLLSFSVPQSICAAEPVASPLVVTKTIASGVTVTQEITTDPPLIINVVSADLSKKGVRLETAIAGDSITGGTLSAARGEQVEVLAARHNAVAAINGDYFTGGDPLGFGVSHGEIYSEPWRVNRAAFGLEPDGRTTLFDVLAFAGHVTASDAAQFNLAAIDRPVAKGDSADLVAFTQLFGPVAGSRPGCTEVVLTGVNLPLSPNKLVTGTVASVTQVVTAPSMIPDDGLVLSAPGTGAASDFIMAHVKVGSIVSLTAAVGPKADLPDAIRVASVPRGEDGGLLSRSGDHFNRSATAWANVDQAIGGGPRLVTDGKITIDGPDEGFDPSFTDRPNPRTAIGVTKDGKILLFAIDGRIGMSAGVTLSQVAAIMLRYGVVNGMNLDGGGSTAMAAGGVTINYPAIPGAGRKVADMLAIYAKSNRRPTPVVALIDAVPPITVGGSTKLVAEADGKPIAGTDSRVIWRGSVDGSVGFVAQDGTFYARAAGPGVITAVIDGMKVTRDVTVLGTSDNTVKYLLTARMDSVAGNANSSIVAAHLADANGAPGAGLTVTISVKGGTVDRDTAVSDEDGIARFTVKWTDSSGSATLSCGSLAPLTLNFDAQPRTDPGPVPQTNPEPKTDSIPNETKTTN